jgi:VCBS repeat-containing protein
LVAGTILGSDNENDTLSYSAPDSTAKGTITLNPDGTFTYSPTAEARVNARLNYDSPADTSDSFTVTVTDGHGGTVEVPVDVTIAPDFINYS